VISMCLFKWLIRMYIIINQFFFIFRLLNADLRRRKRAERTTSMEDKIREMKRKQKLCEDKARESPKKRRSLIISIATGVLLGVICVYAYSKFG